VVGAEAPAVEGATVLPVRPASRFVRNAEFATGLSSSIRAGLRQVSARAQLLGILLGDQPGIRSAAIDCVAERLGGAPPPITIARAVYEDPVSGQVVPGHPVFFRRQAWPELARLVGDAGARELLQKAQDQLTEVPIVGRPLADIDTPTDYGAARG
jgi:molybdenum cofactor cytidylyltransferase